MNHSVSVILDYLCNKYQVSKNLLLSGCGKNEFRKIRELTVFIVGYGRDHELMEGLNLSRGAVIYHRIKMNGYTEHDKGLTAEIEKLRVELLKYEFSRD